MNIELEPHEIIFLLDLMTKRTISNDKKTQELGKTFTITSNDRINDIVDENRLSRQIRHKLDPNFGK